MRSRNRHPLVHPGAAALIAALLLPGGTAAQSGVAPGQAGSDDPGAAPVVMPAPGDTVRVSWADAGHRSVRHEGVVTEAGRDAILLRTSDGIETIPADAMTAVEHGHQRSGWEGFKRGFQVGAVVSGLAGGVIGGVTGAECQGEAFCPGAAGGAAILGVGFGLGGGLVGGLLKSAAPGVEWRDAPVRAMAAPAPGGGATMGLRVSF